jgi:phytanoyl-CoA hydroxylase
MIYGMTTTLSRLRLEEYEAYQNDGFITKNDLLSADQVESVKEALSGLVKKYGPDRELADLKPGEGKGNYAGARIMKKGSAFMFQLEKGQEPAVEDPAAMELQVRKFMNFEDEAGIFREILGEGSLIREIVSELISDEAILYQNQALIKPPKIGSTKPWHQDNAYFSVSPLESVCGVWIAIDEATVQNGCMHMLKGQHKVGALKHEHKRDCEINVRRLDLSTLTPVPLKPGGALFFSGMVPHETPPNRSEHRRRALQFHFRGSRSEILPGPDYDSVFRDADGQPASCEAVRRIGI